MHSRKILTQSQVGACRIQMRRSGFTLIELMVVVAIMLVLTGLTVALYNANVTSERIRGGARQLQSALMGARDRAMQAKQPRGLRLILDPNDPTVVSSFVYITAPITYSQGVVVPGRTGLTTGNGPNAGLATNATVNLVRGYGTNWANLLNEGLLVSGARIRIPANGLWYNIQFFSNDPLDPLYTRTVGTPGPEILGLSTIYPATPVYGYLTQSAPMSYMGSTPYAWGSDNAPGYVNYDDDANGTNDNPEEVGWPYSGDMSDINAFNPSDYALELSPAILPNTNPIVLPTGGAIDLYNSQLPPSWYNQQSVSPNAVPAGYTVEGPDPSNAANVIVRQYSNQMDILFSPRGTIYGALGAQGLIHFFLAEVKDTNQNLSPRTVPQSTGESLIVSLFTKTGAVSSHPVNVNVANPALSDLFKFAETGSVAGK